MKIVVTGALGHIGSSLIRSLPFAFPNSEIILIDNMKNKKHKSWLRSLLQAPKKDVNIIKHNFYSKN